MTSTMLTATAADLDADLAQEDEDLIDEGLACTCCGTPDGEDPTECSTCLFDECGMRHVPAWLDREADYLRKYGVILAPKQAA